MGCDPLNAASGENLNIEYQGTILFMDAMGEATIGSASGFVTERIAVIRVALPNEHPFCSKCSGWQYLNHYL